MLTCFISSSIFLTFDSTISFCFDSNTALSSTILFKSIFFWQYLSISSICFFFDESLYKPMKSIIPVLSYFIAGLGAIYSTLSLGAWGSKNPFLNLFSFSCKYIISPTIFSYIAYFSIIFSNCSSDFFVFSFISFNCFL